MNTESLDDDTAHKIAEKMQRAKLETEYTERMRNLPNPISTDEE